jgi:uncharacterized protein YbjT (DUF2867 family)
MAATEEQEGAAAPAAPAANSPPLARVVVLGARGGTGRLVLKHLVEAGAGQVVAVARNVLGEASDGGKDGGVVEWVQGDVRDGARMAELFDGASAVVFAASASQGWRLRGDNTPKHVDYEAVVRTCVCVHVSVSVAEVVS